MSPERTTAPTAGGRSSGPVLVGSRRAASRHGRGVIDEPRTGARTRETTLSSGTVAVVLALVVPFVLFLIALLFLVSGLLTPSSLARKGPGRFARERLLRLGVRFAAFTLLLWPALEYGLYRPLGYVSASFWRAWLRFFPTSGPLWFVGVLLLLSLAYAGWRAVRPTGTESARTERGR